jgi:hypothetical protein
MPGPSRDLFRARAGGARSHSSTISVHARR